LIYCCHGTISIWGYPRKIYATNGGVDTYIPHL
jgi:hypothetical protein